MLSKVGAVLLLGRGSRTWSWGWSCAGRVHGGPQMASTGFTTVPVTQKHSLTSPESLCHCKSGLHREAPAVACIPMCPGWHCI